MSAGPVTPKRRLSTAQLGATSYHEAGHAVIAQMLGVRVHLISIEPGEHWDGFVRHEKVLSKAQAYVLPDGRKRLRAERLMQIALAGPLAQRRYRRCSFRSAHARSDYENVTDLALSICGSERSTDAYLRWLSIVVTEAVDRHWPIIDVVAKELFERRTLTGTALRELVFAG
jgi:hypothetical protein